MLLRVKSKIDIDAQNIAHYVQGVARGCALQEVR